jgi:hypothetical protein
MRVTTPCCSRWSSRVLTSPSLVTGVHYLYFADESTARDSVTEISGAGWAPQRVARAALDDGSWVVIPERHDVIVDPESVREARVFFEGVVATRPQADYDGWEASL